MADFTFMGYGKKHFKIENSNKARLLAAPYTCMDGINEKGLVVADLMAGDKENTQQDTEKPDLTTTTAIRLLLK